MGNNSHISAHSGAAVLQNCTNCTVLVINKQGDVLSPEERGLIDLYRQLPFRARAQLIQAAVGFEEQARRGLK